MYENLKLLSYNQLSEKLRGYRITYRSMSSKELNEPTGQALTQLIKACDAEIKERDKKMDQHLQESSKIDCLSGNYKRSRHINILGFKFKF